MSAIADFYGYEFEADLDLFTSEFEDIPGVYVIYTPKVCLEIGETEDLRNSLETNNNTREWLTKSEGEDILVAFHPDKDKESRKEKESYLCSKMKHSLFSSKINPLR